MTAHCISKGGDTPAPRSLHMVRQAHHDNTLECHPELAEGKDRGAAIDLSKNQKKHKNKE